MKPFKAMPPNHHHLLFIFTFISLLPWSAPLNLTSGPGSGPSSPSSSGAGPSSPHRPPSPSHHFDPSQNIPCVNPSSHPEWGVHLPAQPLSFDDCHVAWQRLRMRLIPQSGIEKFVWTFWARRPPNPRRRFEMKVPVEEIYRMLSPPFFGIWIWIWTWVWFCFLQRKSLCENP